MRRITPTIGGIYITHNDYQWIYIGNLTWKCLKGSDNKSGWQVGDLYKDDKFPVKLDKGDIYIPPFKNYLKLCNIQESSATKKTS